MKRIEDKFFHQKQLVKLDKLLWNSVPGTRKLLRQPELERPGDGEKGSAYGDILSFISSESVYLTQKNYRSKPSKAMHTSVTKRPRH